MAITKEYFIGEINIAQLSQGSVQESLNIFIEKYTTVYLQKALGYGFAKLYVAGLGIVPIAQRWTDLLSGAEYTNAKGYLKMWTGFENADFNSPIADFIYYWYTRDNATFTAGLGEMAGKSDNAKPTSPALKQSRAWNEMVILTKELYDFLLNKKDGASNLIYPEFDIKQVDKEITERLSSMNL